MAPPLLLSGLSFLHLCLKIFAGSKYRDIEGRNFHLFVLEEIPYGFLCTVLDGETSESPQIYPFPADESFFDFHHEFFDDGQYIF